MKARQRYVIGRLFECRDLDNLDDLHFGIQQEMLYARASPAVPGAQVLCLHIVFARPRNTWHTTQIAL